jgi:hypothetical protein
MRFLLVLAIAFLAMAVPNLAQASSAAVIKCSAPGVKASPAIKQFSAKGGGCTAGGHAVRKRFFNQYTQYDQLSNSCGKALRRPGRFFRLKATPYRLRVRFGVTAKAKARVVWGRWRSFRLGGVDLQCGRLGSSPLPPTSSLCAWDNPEPYPTPGLVITCGVAIPGACAWATGATMVDGVVSAGAIACPQTPCQYFYPSVEPVIWFTPVPILRASELVCPGGTGASVGVKTIALGHYNGAQLVVDCQVRTFGLAVTRFSVPAEWGGVLLVDFRLHPLGSGADAGARMESQTSIFPISGTQDGCPSLKIPPGT